MLISPLPRQHILHPAYWLHHPLEFHHRQRRTHRRRRQFRRTNEVINVTRLMAEQRQQRPFLSIVGQCSLHLNMLWHHEQIQRLQDIIDMPHQARSTILDEFVDTCTPGRENASGYRKDLTAVFEGKIGRNQGTTRLGGFCDQYTEREA